MICVNKKRVASLDISEFSVNGLRAPRNAGLEITLQEFVFEQGGLGFLSVQLQKVDGVCEEIRIPLDAFPSDGPEDEWQVLETTELTTVSGCLQVKAWFPNLSRQRCFDDDFVGEVDGDNATLDVDDGWNEEPGLESEMLDPDTLFIQVRHVVEFLSLSDDEDDSGEQESVMEFPMAFTVRRDGNGNLALGEGLVPKVNNTPLWQEAGLLCH